RQLQFEDNRAYYYVALGLMLAASAVVAWIERHRFGMYLAAIREDEAAAEALGVDAFRCKMLAMALSSFLTGVGGAFLRLLSALAPGQRRLRDPAVGRDHHPDDHRRRGHASRPDPRLAHPHAARGAVARVLPIRGLDRRPPDRLRHAADRGRAVSAQWGLSGARTSPAPRAGRAVSGLAVRGLS